MGCSLWRLHVRFPRLLQAARNISRRAYRQARVGGAQAGGLAVSRGQACAQGLVVGLLGLPRQGRLSVLRLGRAPCRQHTRRVRYDSGQTSSGNLSSGCPDRQQRTLGPWLQCSTWKRCKHPADPGPTRYQCQGHTGSPSVPHPLSTIQAPMSMTGAGLPHLQRRSAPARRWWWRPRRCG